MRAHLPRINSTVFTAFLLVSLPALAVGVLLILLAGQATLRDTYGLHLSHVAQQMAASVDAYVYRKVLDVSMLGRTPDLRRVVHAPVPTDTARLGDNPASRHLADLVAHDPVYREIIVTNAAGQLVAASRPMAPGDLSQEDWWKATVEDDRVGRVFVTHPRWDPDARVSVMGVSAPVPADGTDALTGVVRVVFDARELLAPVAGLQLGATGVATLVRDNGSVVFSRASNDPSARFFATRELVDGIGKLATAEGVREDWLHFSAAGVDGTPHVVGVAQSQLGRSYPSLSWLVAISQAESELVGPVASIGWYLVLLVLATAILVLVVALYFSMRLAAPAIDVDIGLVEHPRVSRMPDTGEDDYEAPLPPDTRPVER
jgi:hypothetical protein